MALPAEPFFDADAKIEQLIYIPGTLWDEEHQPDIFESEFLFGLPERTDAQLYKALPALVRFVGADAREAEPFEVAATFFGVRGFLVQAATPARKYMGESSFYAGWGNYWTEWLYAPTEADIALVVTAWAEERHAADKAKSAETPAS